jgi:hypothetical protein
MGRAVRAPARDLPRRLRGATSTRYTDSVRCPFPQTESTPAPRQSLGSPHIKATDYRRSFSQSRSTAARRFAPLPFPLPSIGDAQ